jgi:hypothetical protein
VVDHLHAMDEVLGLFSIIEDSNNNNNNNNKYVLEIHS